MPPNFLAMVLCLLRYECFPMALVRDTSHYPSRDFSFITKAAQCHVGDGARSHGAGNTNNKARNLRMQTPTSSSPQATPVQRHSFMVDVYCGAVRGDFEENMGAPGYITQATLAFVPV